MQFEPTNNPFQAKDDSLQPVRKRLGGLWIGADQNVESTFVNGDDGKLEQIWISARSEGGKERFVYCNQDAAGRGGTSSFRAMSRVSSRLSMNRL